MENILRHKGFGRIEGGTGILCYKKHIIYVVDAADPYAQSSIGHFYSPEVKSGTNQDCPQTYYTIEQMKKAIDHKIMTDQNIRGYLPIVVLSVNDDSYDEDGRHLQPHIRLIKYAEVVIVGVEREGMDITRVVGRPVEIRKWNTSLLSGNISWEFKPMNAKNKKAVAAHNAEIDKILIQLGKDEFAKIEGPNAPETIKLKALLQKLTGEKE